MRIPLTVKCVAYLCAALALLALAVMFSRGFVTLSDSEYTASALLDGEEAVDNDVGAQRVRQLEDAYRRATLYLFAAACTLLGAAVYGWRAYIRRHREHRADALLWLAVGGVTLAYSIYAFLSFNTGGGAAAVNAAAALMQLGMRLLPFPFAVRALLLAMHRDMPRRGRLALRIAGGGVLLGLVVVLPTVNFRWLTGG